MTDVNTSVVIPVYNEEQTIESLVNMVVKVLNSTEAVGSWEIILVDDGSIDGSAIAMRRLQDTYPNLVMVAFRRNFGKAAALQAGFDHARGDVIITMDADLQDDPEEIPSLLGAIHAGNDVVSGWKKNRQDPLEKRLASRIFNAVVSRLSGIRLHDFNCGLKAYRKWTVQALNLRGNLHRFIPVLAAQRGAIIGEVPVRHRKRDFGASKFGMLRYFHGLFDLLTVFFLTKFSQKPLYFFGIISAPLLFLGSLIGGYLLINHFAFLLGSQWADQLVTRPLLLICISLFGFGLQILLTGLLCEFVLRIRSNGQSYWIRNRSVDK